MWSYPSGLDLRKWEREDLRQHNMVLSNYEGKTNNIMGVVQVDLVVDTTTRLTLFMVIDSKANFNLLLG